MKTSSSDYESKLKHDLKGLILQLESGLKLIENAQDENEKKDIHRIIVKTCATFVEKQKELT